MSDKFTNVLPKNWDGRFMFANDSDEDFIFKWGKRNYLFPAKQRVDLMKMAFNSTPLEVQQIRKIAAKQYGEWMYFKSDDMKQSEALEKDPQTGYPRLTSFHSARSYTESDLVPYIQACLKDYPEGDAQISETIIEIPTLELLHRDEEGEFINKPVENAAKSLAPGEILIN